MPTTHGSACGLTLPPLFITASHTPTARPPTLNLFLWVLPATSHSLPLLFTHAHKNKKMDNKACKSGWGNLKNYINHRSVVKNTKIQTKPVLWVRILTRFNLSKHFLLSTSVRRSYALHFIVIHYVSEPDWTSWSIFWLSKYALNVFWLSKYTFTDNHYIEFYEITFCIFVRNL